MKNKFFLLSLISILSLAAQAKVFNYETVEYDDVFNVIDELEMVLPSEQILVVFDIDDTLLVIEHCVKPDGKPTKGIGKLFSCPSEHTESDLADRIQAIQKKGIHTIALTARGNNLVKATQRELVRKHTGKEVFNFDGLPFSANFKSVEVQKTKRCRSAQTPPCLSGDVSNKPKFEDGVMYANGTHKGLALIALLKKLKATDYKAVVFVDDRKKNTVNMAQVFEADDSIELHNFLYLRHRD